MLSLHELVKIRLMKNQEIGTSDMKSFHYLESGEVAFSTFSTKKSVAKLDSGVYSLTWLSYPHDRVQVNQLGSPEPIAINQFAFKDKIDRLINSFFNEDIVKIISDRGFFHKIGLLFYGKEGTGKSSIIKHYYNQLLINNQALVFNLHQPEYLNKVWDFVQRVRNIQDNPIVIVMDEFDEFLDGKHNEGVVKSILDGNMSINNCVILAATNYLDRIPETVKDRPSRFKYTLCIEGIQSASEVLIIVSNILLDRSVWPQEKLVEFSEKLKGETLDVIKSFCIDEIMSLEKHSVGNRKRIGFK
jgi:SpoVK/Ycf46/Vps4 family AAA+-type ATPase